MQIFRRKNLGRLRKTIKTLIELLSLPRCPLIANRSLEKRSDIKAGPRHVAALRAIAFNEQCSTNMVGFGRETPARRKVVEE